MRMKCHTLGRLRGPLSKNCRRLVGDVLPHSSDFHEKGRWVNSDWQVVDWGLRLCCPGLLGEGCAQGTAFCSAQTFPGRPELFLPFLCRPGSVCQIQRLTVRKPRSLICSEHRQERQCHILGSLISKYCEASQLNIL